MSATLFRPRQSPFSTETKRRHAQAFHPRADALEERCLLATTSLNIAVIGGPTVTNGGSLPVCIPEHCARGFTNMAPGEVTSANLAPFDTVVLNVASSQMGCKTSTLTSQSKQDLVTWLGQGNKLVIYDSECTFGGSVDYTWLPFPFTTNNPGAYGAHGTLTIIENNSLSCAIPSSPYYIDAGTLGSKTDAVGDANVMTTFDPNWCLDMSATNRNNVTGPVHAYAHYRVGSNTGLIIYNGLDVDYMNDQEVSPDPTSSAYGLYRIFIQEIEQPFNPSNLPCGVTVVGITLTQDVASEILGNTHTVTATLTDLLGKPMDGLEVTFDVIAGPNIGVTGVRNPTDGISDTAGQVQFTYSATRCGVDTIIAKFTMNGQCFTSQQLDMKWVSQSCVRLEPVTSEFEAGQMCTVTATVVNHDGSTLAGAPVQFEVISGPNAGASSTMFPADGLSDENGHVTFTYRGAGGVGTDVVVARATISEDAVLVSPTSLVNWLRPTEPPVVTGLARYGYHIDPTLIVVMFSDPMVMDRVQQPTNYRLTFLGRDMRLGTCDDVVIPIKDASYNAEAQSVALSPTRQLPLHYRYALQISGDPESGLVSESGVPLDGAGSGEPGTNYLRIFDRKALVMTSPVVPKPVPEVTHKPTPIRYTPARPQVTVKPRYQVREVQHVTQMQQMERLTQLKQMYLQRLASLRARIVIGRV